MNNILVVNVNWVGDVIFSSPIFKALKTAYPQARISCMAVPRVKEILEMIPDVDDIILYDEKGRHIHPWTKLGLILELRKKKFDACFLLHRSWTRALLVYLAGIPVRVGYEAKKRGILLTHKVQSAKEPLHRADYYLRVIESFGVQAQDRTCAIKTTEEDQHYIEQLLKENHMDAHERFVVIHVGGNWNLKRWPEKNFALLIDRLQKERDVRVVLIASAKDEDLIKRVADFCSNRPVLLAGRTNLKQLAALMQQAFCVISNDSGPLHIANSVGTKSIALFGPTRSEITGPRGKATCEILQNDIGCNRAACYHLVCPDNSCMKSITVNDVCEAFKKI
ncbi:MAG: lipopolysaccharide heptosyltransferase II [Candidatus Omnitrophota bacterium]